MDQGLLISTLRHERGYLCSALPNVGRLSL